MNKFNKLYNFILESIISLNKISRKNMILKAILKEILKPSVGTRWLTYFATLDNKVADFLCKFVADGTIVLRSDERIDTVIKILKLNPSIDTQHYTNSLNLFINQYIDSVNKHLLKIAGKTIKYLDSVPLFYDKQTYLQNVVVYKVKDTKEGMMAVRRIIDLQWGEDANPWCLAARDEEYGYQDSETYNGEDEYVDEELAVMRDAWCHWNQYNKFPKQIAFQDGKLLAFRASDREEYDIWWDRNDHLSDGLKLRNGKQLLIDDPLWSDEEKAYKESTKVERFIKNNYLKLNLLTGRYDCSEATAVTIELENLVNGEIPVPLGYIHGNFMIDGCRELKSLKNGPTHVKGDFAAYGCYNLLSLEYAPEYVKDNMFINNCPKISTLSDYDGEVGGMISFFNCPNIEITLKDKQKYNIKVDHARF